MKTKRENNIIRFPVSKFEEAEDRNEEIVASTKAEQSNLCAVEEVLNVIDGRNGEMGDEPIINHARNLIRASKSQNIFQYENSYECMRLYSKVYGSSGDAA